MSDYDFISTEPRSTDTEDTDPGPPAEEFAKVVNNNNGNNNNGSEQPVVDHSGGVSDEAGHRQYDTGPTGDQGVVSNLIDRLLQVI